MANRKFFRRKKTNKKRRRVARKRAVKNLSMVTFGLGLPKKCLVTHKYTQNFQIQSTLGVLGTTQFTCNGMFDPDITGSGHQPMYFDQFSALYDHYTVIGSKMKITFANTSTGNASGRFVIMQQDDSTIASSAVDAVSENSLGSWKMLAAGDNNVHTIFKKWSAKKTFGGSVLGNDNLQGTVAANPVELSVYTLGYAVGTAVTQSIDVVVEIDYIAIWDELKELASS